MRRCHNRLQLPHNITNTLYRIICRISTDSRENARIFLNFVLQHIYMAVKCASRSTTSSRKASCPAVGRSWTPFHGIRRSCSATVPPVLCGRHFLNRTPNRKLDETQTHQTNASMRHCFWSCLPVKYNCSYENKNHEVTDGVFSVEGKYINP